MDVEAQPKHVLRELHECCTSSVLVIVAATLALAYAAGRSWSVRRRALVRLYAVDDHRVRWRGPSSRDTALARWLARAGYRRPNAQTLFIAATVACVGSGRRGQPGIPAGSVPARCSMRSSNVPGSAGDVLILVLQGGPWIVFVDLRRCRRRSSCAPRGGRAFAPSSRICRWRWSSSPRWPKRGWDSTPRSPESSASQGSGRALVSEFVNFQHDMLAGMSRIQALRQLARRIDVPSLTSFTSALIQAEQVGASMAETLQHQAVDLRQRRRENALLRAQALPVKLVFPLVVCFLPGIFVSTLAPVLFQMVEVANSVLRSSGR